MDAGLQGKEDPTHFKYAKGERRVIIIDLHFLILAKKEEHPGVVFLEKHLEIGELLEEIEKIVKFYSAEDLENLIFLPCWTKSE